LAGTNPIELEIKPTAAMKARVLAIMLIAAFLGIFLSYLMFGGGGDFFAQKTTLTTYMPDATGLATASEVRLSGIRIGKVDSVEFSGLLDPQRAIRVQASILKRYLKSIPIDSQTDIGSDTLVGYAFVDINEGKSATPLGEGGILQSEPLKQAVDRADMVKVLQNNLDRVDQILIDVSSGQTKLGQFVRGDAEYNQLLSGIGNFDNAMHAFITPRSQVGQAFFSLQMYNQIRDSVLRADNTLLAIQRGEGAAGKLFASDAQYDDLVRQLTGLRASLADLNASPMMQNDQSYRSLQKMLAATDSLLNSLNAGEGRTGQLLASPQLYESLNGSLRAMQEMLRDLQSNPRKYLRFNVF
jgi:phospholipid/cholesterol/gamma-HCH transport system substrate-binding protein